MWNTAGVGMAPSLVSNNNTLPGNAIKAERNGIN